ncbi:MAG TPA: L-aspartate oxidase [Bacteroidales bacterium]|jgi:L-aspartate oxidase|nr:L-aspartate oxidase [Bacteroidales bacterium]HNV96418.1 L-aspartate oxidase [Bacteroidales bacterium]
MKFDFLILGSGIAGLAFALKAAEKGTVCIVTKKKLEDTNTKYAQGGIASVTYTPDSFEKHVKDTLIAGAGLCNEEVVRMVVKEAPERIEDLIKWGIQFDKDNQGRFHLAREGGHSEYRILHHKDKTGDEIQQVLSQRVRENKNITVLEYHFAIDLITQHHLGKEVKRSMTDIECYGVYVHNLKENNIFTILSKITLIATGGIGNIYSTTTNPPIATGDGIAMLYRAKGYCENMEFIQFHPTAFYYPSERPAFLITEALRGFGAKLKTIDGYYFMKDFDSRLELAPRDIVARAIDYMLKKTGDDHVLLDASHLNKNDLIDHFPTIYAKCLKRNVDITRDPIPVVPAAHYLCGGIKVNQKAQTSIHNLYAAGECASTGLHGANRLASNSLIEAIVFAHLAYIDSLNKIDTISFQENIPDWNDEGTTHPKEMILITHTFKELQQLMTNYVGIVRSNERLHRAFERLKMLHNETENLYKTTKISPQLCELRNSINVAYLIIKAAMERKQSIGLHYNLDYLS